MKLSVRVSTRAKQDQVIRVSDQSFKVFTTKPALQGKANQAVLELLAKHLHLKKSQVSLVAGTTSRDKIVEVNE